MFPPGILPLYCWGLQYSFTVEYKVEEIETQVVFKCYIQESHISSLPEDFIDSREAFPYLPGFILKALSSNAVLYCCARHVVTKAEQSISAW